MLTGKRGRAGRGSSLQLSMVAIVQSIAACDLHSLAIANSDACEGCTHALWILAQTGFDFDLQSLVYDDQRAPRTWG